MCTVLRIFFDISIVLCALHYVSLRCIPLFHVVNCRLSRVVLYALYIVLPYVVCCVMCVAVMFAICLFAIYLDGVHCLLCCPRRLPCVMCCTMLDA